MVAGERYGGVDGRSKKEAEQRAAEAAFAALTADDRVPLPRPTAPATEPGLTVPELPEVETVRAGLARWIVGRTIDAVEVRHPRAVRRHPAGARGLRGGSGRSDGDRRSAAAASTSGSPLDSGDAVVGHLGMSGQLLLLPAAAPDGPHLRIRFSFADGDPELRFVDQRTFGGLAVSAGRRGAARRDRAHRPRPVRPGSSTTDRSSAALRPRRTGVKRALLDQTLISGVGNIYADEALWRAQLHGARPTRALTRPAVRRLLEPRARGACARRSPPVAPASTRCTST